MTPPRTDAESEVLPCNTANSVESRRRRTSTGAGEKVRFSDTPYEQLGAPKLRSTAGSPPPWKAAKRKRADDTDENTALPATKKPALEAPTSKMVWKTSVPSSPLPEPGNGKKGLTARRGSNATPATLSAAATPSLDATSSHRPKTTCAGTEGAKFPHLGSSSTKTQPKSGVGRPSQPAEARRRFAGVDKPTVAGAPPQPNKLPIAKEFTTSAAAPRSKELAESTTDFPNSTMSAQDTTAAKHRAEPPPRQVTGGNDAQKTPKACMEEIFEWFDQEYVRISFPDGSLQQYQP